MISNQDKSLGIEQGSQTDGLADLWSFVYDAEIKPATCEKGMLDAHTGGSHYQLEREREDPYWMTFTHLSHNIYKWNVLKQEKDIRCGFQRVKLEVVAIIIFCKLTPHLLVIKLLQLWQCANSLLPRTFLCVRQDVWMNLEKVAENKQVRGGIL